MNRRHFLQTGLTALALTVAVPFAVQARTNPTPDLTTIYNGPDNPAVFRQVIDAKSRDQVLFVMHYASWCGYCRQLTHSLEAAQSQTALPYSVLKLDVEQFPAIAGSFRKGRSVPETHVYLERQQIENFSGAYPISTLVKYMNDLEKQRTPSASAPIPSAT